MAASSYRSRQKNISDCRFFKPKTTLFIVLNVWSSVVIRCYNNVIKKFHIITYSFLNITNSRVEMVTKLTILINFWVRLLFW